MNSRCALCAMAVAAAAASAPLSARAMTVLTLTWGDVQCTGPQVQGCGTAPGSFSAVGDANAEVSVSATLHYTYRDDGQPLPEGAWVFPGSGTPARERYEVGALYFYSNACSSFAECMGRPIDQWGSFNFGSAPYVLGRNDAPDNLSGDIALRASGRGTAWVDAMGATFDARGVTTISVSPAIPEPATYALMLAGLVSSAFLARRRGVPRGR